MYALMLLLSLLSLAVGAASESSLSKLIFFWYAVAMLFAIAAAADYVVAVLREKKSGVASEKRNPSEIAE